MELNETHHFEAKYVKSNPGGNRAIIVPSGTKQTTCKGDKMESKRRRSETKKYKNRANKERVENKHDGETNSNEKREKRRGKRKRKAFSRRRKVYPVLKRSGQPPPPCLPAPALALAPAAPHTPVRVPTHGPCRGCVRRVLRFLEACFFAGCHFRM